MTTTRASSKFFLILIFFALFLRVFHLNLPFLESYNSIGRQTIGASIARNFYENGFNFFYPEINENGPGPYLFNLEMQFNTYLAALGYWLAGGVYEWIARGVSVLFSMGMLVLLYFFTKRIAGQRAALWTLFFASIMPLHMALSRAVQPEETLLLASVGAFVFYYFYQETKKNRFFALSCLFMFVAIGSKLYSVYLFIPLLFMGWQYEGLRVFKQPRNYAYLMVALTACLWWWFMWRIGYQLDLAYTSYHYKVNRAGEGLSYWQVMMQPGYLKYLGKMLFAHILTPLGTLFFLAGFLKKDESRLDFFLRVWSVCVVFFLLVFLRAALQHPYYLAPFIPVGAIYIGRGSERILTNPALKRLARNPVILILVILLQTASVIYFYRGLYSVPLRLQPMLEAGRAVERLTPKESLVVACNGSSPAQLYYTHRKGWSFSLVPERGETLEGRLEEIRKKGAGYFLVSAMDEWENAPAFRAYVESRFRRVAEGKDYLLFDLGGRL